MTTSVLAKRSLGSDIINYDAIIIGAGLGNLRTSLQLCENPRNT
jgi:succinate dehydrogenase/fumarate reductase flavoprotein subunit